MPVELISAIIAAVLGSTVLNTIVTRLFALKDRKRGQNATINASLKWLMLDMLERQGKTYIQQGYITKNQWKAFEEAYHLYHDADKLAGNGYATKIYEGVQALDITLDN